MGASTSAEFRIIYVSDEASLKRGLDKARSMIQKLESDMSGGIKFGVSDKSPLNWFNELNKASDKSANVRKANAKSAADAEINEARRSVAGRKKAEEEFKTYTIKTSQLSRTGQYGKSKRSGWQFSSRQQSADTLYGSMSGDELKNIQSLTHSARQQNIRETAKYDAEIKSDTAQRKKELTELGKSIKESYKPDEAYFKMMSDYRGTRASLGRTISEAQSKQPSLDLSKEKDDLDVLKSKYKQVATAKKFSLSSGGMEDLTDYKTQNKELADYIRNIRKSVKEKVSAAQAEERATESARKSAQKAQESISRHAGGLEERIKGRYAKASNIPGVDWSGKEAESIRKIKEAEQNLRQAETRSRGTGATDDDIRNLGRARQAYKETYNSQVNSIKEIESAYGKEKTAFNKANDEKMRGINQFGIALKRIAIWWASAGLLWQTGNLVKQVFNLTASVEYLTAELTAMGEEGAASYKKLAESGFDAAAMTGRSFNEAATAMKEWVRQGYSAAEINDLVKTTLIGLNVTEMDTPGLIASLTAEMRAFNIPASDSITIIDKLMAVSRKYAVDANQLAVGIRRFAGSSQIAGMSMDQQMGVMTAVMQRTKQSAEMTGTALRAITNRMRSSAIEAIQSIGKIDVYTDKTNSTFRNQFDVLTDLAAAWPRLSGAQQQALVQAAAGQRQTEFFIAAMKDWTIAEDSAIISMGAAGTAYRQNAILVNTLQKSVAGLSAEWQKALGTQTGLADYFRTIIEGLRSIVEYAQVIPKWVAPAASALALLAGTAMAISGSGGIQLAGIGLAAGGLGSLVAYLKGAGKGVHDLSEKYRQMIDTQADSATGTNDLAKMYIKLYDAQGKSSDNADQLRSILKEIYNLNPSLISQTTRLADAYDILRDATGKLNKAQEEKHKKQMDYKRAELEAEMRTLRGNLRDLQNKAPEEMKGLGPEKFGEVAAQGVQVTEKFKDNASKVSQSYFEIVNFAKDLKKTKGWEFTDADIDLMSQMRHELFGLKEVWTKMREAEDEYIAREAGTFRNIGSGLSTVDLDNAKIYVKIAKAIEELDTSKTKTLSSNKQLQLSSALTAAAKLRYKAEMDGNKFWVANLEKDTEWKKAVAVAYEALKKTKEEYNAIDLKPIIIKDAGTPEGAKLDQTKLDDYKRQYEEILKLKKENAETQVLFNRALLKTTLTEANRPLVADEVFKITAKEAEQLKIIGDERESEIARLEVIAGYHEGGLEYLNNQQSLLKGVLSVESAITEEERKNTDNAQKNLEKQYNRLEKLYNLQQEYNDILKEQNALNQSEQLKASNQPISAAQFMLNFRTDEYNKARQEFIKIAQDSMKADQSIVKDINNIENLGKLKGEVNGLITELTKVKDLAKDPKSTEHMAGALDVMAKLQASLAAGTTSVTKEMLTAVMEAFGVANSEIVNILNQGGDIVDSKFADIVKSLQDKMGATLKGMGLSTDDVNTYEKAFERVAKFFKDMHSDEGELNKERETGKTKLKELAEENTKIRLGTQREMTALNRGNITALQEELSAMQEVNDALKAKQAEASKVTNIYDTQRRGMVEAAIADRAIQIQENENEIAQKQGELGLANATAVKNIYEAQSQAKWDAVEAQIQLKSLTDTENNIAKQRLQLEKDKLADMLAEAAAKHGLQGLSGQALISALPTDEQLKLLDQQQKITTTGSEDALSYMRGVLALKQKEVEQEKLKWSIARDSRNIGLSLRVGEEGILQQSLKDQEDYIEQRKIDLFFADNIIDKKTIENDLIDLANEKERTKIQLQEVQLSNQDDLNRLAIQFAAQQIAGVVSGQGGISSFISGIVGLGASAAGQVNPILEVLIAAFGTFLSPIFDEFTKPASDLADSIDKNVVSIDRNTSALKDVTEKFISVPSGFVLPSAYARPGGIPSYGAGGSVPYDQLAYLHRGEKIIPASDNRTMGPVTIIVNGSGDVDKIAIAVQSNLERVWNIDKRRGYVSSRY